LARDTLAAHCAGWKAGRKDVGEVVIVFDGDSSVVGVGPGSMPGVRAIFTRTDEEADQRICRMIRTSRAPRQIVLISDDAEVVGIARAHGAGILSVSAFHGFPARGRDAGSPDKDSLTARQRQEISRSLARDWGLARAGDSANGRTHPQQ
jgi:hypothetical protein